MDPIQMLMSDHRKVEQLFAQAMQAGDGQQIKRIAMEIDKELTVHAEIEEKIVYPAVRKLPQFADLIKEAYEEHGEVKKTLNQIAAAEPTSAEGKQLMMKLQKAVEHHVKEEEGELFKKMQQTLDQNMLMQLGQQIQKAKSQAEPAVEMLGQQKLQYEMMGNQGMQSSQM